MRGMTAVLVVGASLALYGCTTGESYVRAGYDFGTVDKVAIVDVVGDLQGEAAKNQIADFFSMELLRKGFLPVERWHVQSLLKQQEFEAGTSTVEDSAVRAGRILNVPGVLIINVPNFGDEISITAKMLDVKDGNVLWIGSGTGTVGVLVGAPGKALTPQAAEKAREIIKSMCENLPSRRL